MAKPATDEVHDEPDVIKSGREVIERKLLTALCGEWNQVAILATEDDVMLLIEALASLSSQGPARGRHAKAQQWARDLELLRRSAFPSVT